MNVLREVRRFKHKSMPLRIISILMFCVISIVTTYAWFSSQKDVKLGGLEGNVMPLGYAGQEIYVNPARGRVYNIDDFAGLLAKYESDVKAEYSEINFDVQYPVTIIRKELEKAFVSWGDFESFLMGISTSLYNGAYIDDYKYTAFTYRCLNCVLNEVDEEKIKIYKNICIKALTSKKTEILNINNNF